MSNPLTHESLVETSPLFMPAITTGGEQKRGIPFFRNTITSKPEPFDPWNLKREKRINSTVMMVLAEKGHGKTTFNIACCTRLGARRAGDDRMRVTIDDHRRDDGSPEYEELIKFWGGEHVNLAEYELNVLDMAMKMRPHQQLRAVKVCLEHTFGRKLNVKESEALRYSLRKVRKLFPKTADLDLLGLALRNLTKGDVLGFQAGIIAAIAKRHGDSPGFHQLVQDGGGVINSHKNNKFKSKPPAINSDGKVNLKKADPEAVQLNKNQYKFGRQTKGLLKAAANLGSMVEELLDGEYGQIFGGQHSLAEVLSKPIVAFDYSGMSEEAVMLYQTLLWEWKTAALVNRNKQFQFDIEIHDENYSMWQYAPYARAMHKYLKQIRSYGTFVIMSTHRLSDYRTVGKKSSREYQLATNMLSDVGIWLIGKLDRLAAEEAGERLLLSDGEVQDIQTLETGNWGLKIGNEPIRWVTLDLTIDEAEISASDAANDRMAIVD